MHPTPLQRAFHQSWQQGARAAGRYTASFGFAALVPGSALIFRDMKIRFGDIIGGCFLTGWILVILLFGLSAIVGLITGEIFLPDKRGGGGTLHGATARIVSVIILVVCTFILRTMWKAKRRSRQIHPMDLPIDRDLERMRERRRRRNEQAADVTPGVNRRESAGDDDKGDVS